MDSELVFPDQAKAQESYRVARHLIRCYLAARDGLRELGVLRTERNLQGDYAEWLVAQMLQLKLATSTVEQAVDAFDREGRSYQIKSRLVQDIHESTSFDFSKIEDPFDYLIGVLFTHELEALAVIKVPYDVVVELGSQTAARFSFRWHRSVSEDPRIEKLIWPSST